MQQADSQRWKGRAARGPTLAVKHAQDGLHVRVQLQAVLPEAPGLRAALVQVPQRACRRQPCACGHASLQPIGVRVPIAHVTGLLLGS